MPVSFPSFKTTIDPNCLFLTGSLNSFASRFSLNWQDSVAIAEVVAIVVGAVGAWFDESSIACGAFAALSVLSLYKDYFIHYFDDTRLLKEGIESLTQEKQKLQEGQAAAQLKVTEFETQYTDLQGLKQKQDKEASEVLRNLNDLQTKVSVLDAENDRLKEEQRTAQLKVTELKRQYDDLQRTKEQDREIQASSEKLQETLQSRLEEYNTYSEETKKLNLEIEKLKKIISTLTQQVTEFTTQNIELGKLDNSTVIDIDSQLTGLARGNDSISDPSAMALYQGILKNQKIVKASFTSLSSREIDLANQIQTYQTSTGVLQTELDSKDEELKRLKENFDSLTGQAQEAKRQLNEIQQLEKKSLEDVPVMLDSKKQELKQLQEDLQAAKIEYKDLLQELSEKKAEREVEETKLNNVKENFDSLTSQIQQAKQKKEQRKAELEKMIEKKTKELDNIGNALAKKDSEFMGLMVEFNAKQEALKSINTELAQKQEELKRVNELPSDESLSDESPEGSQVSGSPTEGFTKIIKDL